MTENTGSGCSRQAPGAMRLRGLFHKLLPLFIRGPTYGVAVSLGEAFQKATKCGHSFKIVKRQDVIVG